MNNNFKEMTLDEMIVKREELRRHLHDQRAKKIVGQLNNPVELRIIKRNIARLNTRIYNFGIEDVKEG